MFIARPGTPRRGTASASYYRIVPWPTTHPALPENGIAYISDLARLDADHHCAIIRLRRSHLHLVFQRRNMAQYLSHHVQYAEDWSADRALATQRECIRRCAWSTRYPRRRLIYPGMHAYEDVHAAALFDYGTVVRMDPSSSHC